MTVSFARFFSLSLGLNMFHEHSFLKYSVVAYLLIVCIVWLWRVTIQLPLPPHPRSLVKEKAIASMKEPWRRYAEWSKLLGPLLLVSSIGKKAIVMNTSDAALSILGRPSCQCKPRWPMAELLGRQKNVGFQRYGNRLRKSRKILHASLCFSSIKDNWSTLLDEFSLQLLRNFFIRPEKFYDDVHKDVQELIVRFTYGKIPDDQYLDLAKTVMRETSIALQPGRWMVNFIPSLSWIPAWMPGAGFQRWARNAKQSFLKMTREPFEEVKADMLLGCATPSFVKHALQNLSLDRPEDIEDVIQCAAGSLFSAGTETLVSAILTFFALIAHHPEDQVHAFDEIRSQIGGDRLPQVEDVNILPYVGCIIQEVYRFNPAIPLVAHSNIKEEQYDGFRVPCRSWLIANVWAMLHDPSAYKDPEVFRPERFLESSGVQDPRTFVFGFGRRRCPGVHFADTVLFLVVSRVLALFEIMPEESSPLPIQFSTGLVPTPIPFRVYFKPRKDAKNLFASLTESRYFDVNHDPIIRTC